MKSSNPEGGAAQGASDGTLTVCTGDKMPNGPAFAHRFPGELAFTTLNSKTLRAGLLFLPNGAALLVAILPTAEGAILACRTGYRNERVPVGKSCSAAGVTVAVPDPANPTAVEVVFPDGRKERHPLPELVLP